MNHTIRYKIVNEYDAHESEGTIMVFRQIGAGEWKLVLPYSGMKRITTVRTEREAREIIARNVNSDKSAASRLGIELSVEIG